jgi:hypothetical protein
MLFDLKLLLKVLKQKNWKIHSRGETDLHARCSVEVKGGGERQVGGGSDINQ